MTVTVITRDGRRLPVSTAEQLTDLVWPRVPTSKPDTRPIFHPKRSKTRKRF